MLILIQFLPTEPSIYTQLIFNLTFLLRCEYFLIDYLEKIGNFNSSYIDTTFAVEGYHDLYNFSASELKTQSSILAKRKLQGKSNGDNRIYEFVFIPNSGFLNSNLPLMTNCELKLSFDRANAEVAMLEHGAIIKTGCSGSPLVIKDCVAIAEYVTSEALEKYFMNIDYNPIPYYYQDCDITLKNLPLEETNIRLDNIKGGSTPTCIFAGLIASSSLNGDLAHSCTAFNCNNVTSMSITLNGNAVNGYPIDIKNNSPIFPFYTLMDVTNRYMNASCGEGMKLAHFVHNWIYAHKFEAETSSQGWIGVNLKLSEPFKEPYTLVIWSINECGITIDKFHQIEKINM